MRITTCSIAAVVLTVAGMVSASSPASALVSGASTTESGVNSTCFDALVLAGETQQNATEQCSYTLTTDVSAPQLAPNARSSTIQTGSPVSRILWTQTYSTLSYTEVHKGVTYFDGKNAWSAVSHLGYTGNHTCNASGSSAFFGYFIDNVACDETVSLSGASIVQRDTFRVSFGIAPLISTYNVAISVLINCNGG